jgi:acyl dehydratase
MARTLTLADFQDLVGSELGCSRWILVDQPRIDGFATVTEDHQFIHVDPVRAAGTPFGTTVAHGFLTLSLLAPMAYDAMPEIEGAQMGVNYGLNKVRFITPVRSGQQIRGRFNLVDSHERSPGVVASTVEVTVEIADEQKPALIAEWVTLAFF